MSKSYGKYKTIGMCYGNNTPYYKERRIHQRRVNRGRLRNVIANYHPEDIDDKFMPYEIPREDQWDEPTDGHWKEYPKELKRRLKWHGYNGIYLTKDGKRVKR